MAISPVMERSTRLSLLTNDGSVFKLPSLQSFLGPFVWPFLLENGEEY